jgi:hypothetical protein
MSRYSRNPLLLKETTLQNSWIGDDKYQNMGA